MGAAFAQVRFESLSDLVFCRPPGFCEKSGSLHDHAIDAVPALGRLLVDERLLQRMGLFRRTKTLQGDNFRTINSGDWHDAGAQCLAEIVHRTRATLCQSATEVHAMQPELVTQGVQQGHVRIGHLQDMWPTVDGEFDGRGHDPTLDLDGAVRSPEVDGARCKASGTPWRRLSQVVLLWLEKERQ